MSTHNNIQNWTPLQCDLWLGQWSVIAVSRVIGGYWSSC